MRYLSKTILAAAIILTLFQLEVPAQGPPVSVKVKSWPAGYFFKNQKVSVKERQKILEEIDGKLRKLNADGDGLLVKGTVIEELRIDTPVYPRLSVLDESGLKVIVHQVPNLYYQFFGPKYLMNKNVFMVIRKVRINAVDSTIAQGLVIEGDFLGYERTYIQAIQKDLENAARRAQMGQTEPPVPPRRGAP